MTKMVKKIENRDIPTAFNDHFIDLGCNLLKNIPLCSRKPEMYINELTQGFTFSDITEQDVYQLLLSLSLTEDTCSGQTAGNSW